MVGGTIEFAGMFQPLTARGRNQDAATSPANFHEISPGQNLQPVYRLDMAALLEAASQRSNLRELAGTPVRCRALSGSIFGTLYLTAAGPRASRRISHLPRSLSSHGYGGDVNAPIADTAGQLIDSGAT